MFGAAFVAGGVFGAKHALEADHVAAVATLVEDTDEPARTGTAWGIGHSIPVVFLGTVFLLVGVHLPASVATAMELLVGVVLIALGIRAIAGREALGARLLTHVHAEDGHPHVHDEDDHQHSHVHGEDSHQHHHVRVHTGAIGLTHSHTDEASFAVGIVHGLAGSGGVVVALVAAAGTPIGGLAFLGGFTVATIGAMALVTAGWARLGGHAGRLRVAAGVLSVGIGLVLFAETLSLV